MIFEECGYTPMGNASDGDICNPDDPTSYLQFRLRNLFYLRFFFVCIFDFFMKLYIFVV